MVSLQERIQRGVHIREVLQALYPNPRPPLDHQDPFTLLVAVALSAQTTDARVNLVTPALFELASTPQKMAVLRVDQILAKIKTCGLAPTKAKNLKKMAQMIVHQFGGQVPRTFEELESLPGVGHKTASVVMSQAFGVPAFPVDTHIHRLAKRWGLTRGKTVEETERDLKKVFPENTWNPLHLQIIFYGREHCTARGCGGPTQVEKQCELCRTFSRKSASKKPSSTY
jgi:endonuclease-3